MKNWNVKKTTMQRVWSIILCLCMVLGSVPVASIAAVAEGLTATDTGSTPDTSTAGATEAATEADTESAPDTTPDEPQPTEPVSCAEDDCDGVYQNGICSKCGGYQAPDGLGTTEKPYKIANAGQLYWFAAQVNGGNTSICGKLIANIIVNPGKFDKDGNYTVDAKTATPRKWTPIGTTTNQLYADFDGNNHTIYGLYCCVENGRAGFIGNMGAFTVKNLTIKNSYFEGKTAGAIAAYSDGATCTVCAVGSNVYVKGDEAGGLVGSANGRIQNCYSLATVSGKNYGGLVGSNYAAIENCYTSSMRPVGSNSASYGGSMTNVYYAEDTTDYSKPDADGYTTQKPTFEGATEVKDFSDGKLAYTLQWNLEEAYRESTDLAPEIWKQTIDTDNYPNFTGKKVYSMINTGCYKNESEHYSNTENATYEAPHNYDNGFCTYCGGFQSAVKNADGVYEIGNAGQLYWFAALVNNDFDSIGFDSSANAKLTADIVVNPGKFDEYGNYTPVASESLRMWTPIGKNNDGYKYIGTFDGAKSATENYTISGLYVNYSEESLIGLFAAVGAEENDGNLGTVKNVNIDNSYFRGLHCIGGIAGGNYYGNIVNCHNLGATVVALASGAGGIVGDCTGKVENCSNAASVSNSESETAKLGGIAGTALGGRSNSKIVNCTNSGTVSAKGEAVGGIVGYAYESSRIENCTNSGTVSGGSEVGGIVGTCAVPVKSCVNSGKISGTSYVGGIVGSNSQATDDTKKVSRCANSGDITGFTYVGGIMGGNFKALDNCKNTGKITGEDTVGGVVGRNDSSVSASFSTGLITITGYDKTNAGGVAGFATSTGSFENCYYLDDSASISVGGDSAVYTGTAVKFASAFASGDVTYLLNQGETNGTQVWYQTCGKGLPDFSGKTVYMYFDCLYYSRYANKEVSDESHYYNDNGFCASCGAYQPAVKNSDGVYEIGNAGQLFWFAQLVNGENGAQDTEADAKLVADIVVNPGTFNEKGKYTPASNEDYDAEPREWTPIAWISDAAYTGTFDGAKNATDNYVISGIYCSSNNSTQDNAGLFGVIGKDGDRCGTVKNVTLKNCYFKGSGYVAGIVAYNYGGCVTNCHTTDGSYVYGEVYVGGIVGLNGGQTENCTNAATVTGVSNSSNLGGVVGCNQNIGQIVSCSNYGKVEGFENVGGIVGLTEGTVMLCDNNASVTGVSYNAESGENVGGIAGYVLEQESAVINCYNIAEVYAQGNYVGGIAGKVESSTLQNCYNYAKVSSVAGGHVGAIAGALAFTCIIQNCYYLYSEDDPDVLDGEGISQNGIGTDLGSSLPDEDGECNAMSDDSFRSGEVAFRLNGGTSEPAEGETLVWYQDCSQLDLPGFVGKTVYQYTDCQGNVNYLNEKKADGHDYDNGFCNICGDYQPCEGGGYASDPYLIANGGNLYWFAARTAEDGSLWGELTANITINEDLLKEDGSPDDGEGVWLREWTPIRADEDFNFYGTFDGKNFTISGLYFSDSTADYVGLFGCVGQNGVVKNVKITDSYFGGKGDVGSIAGYSFYGSIENCTSSATVKGCAPNVGGIVGESTYSSIENCSNSGKVDSSSFNVGGVVGQKYYGKLKKCSNSGNITGTYTSTDACVGGVCGSNQGSYGNYIEDCYNTGNVTAAGMVVGGVVGENMDDGLLRCYNTGDITSENPQGCVGGVCGQNDGPLHSVYNTGKVSGKGPYVGGLVGENEGSVTDGYNTGTVSGTDYVGGIVGVNRDRATCEECYYLKGCATDSYKTVHNGIGSRDSQPVADESGATIAATKAQFESGEITYLLNGERFEGTEEDPVIWKQTLGTDKSPNFTGKIVRGIVSFKCDGTAVYSNNAADIPDDTPSVPSHPFNTDGFCTACGACQPCEKDASGVYLIKNVGNLYWFAAQVNSGNTTINGKLTADITVNPGTFDKDGKYTPAGSETVREWISMGSSRKKFTGTFDGDGHTISGLYQDDVEENHFGLFACIGEGATVTNVTVKNSYFRAECSAGAIVACNRGGTIKNCHNVNTFVVGVKGSSEFVGIGGIVGSSEGGSVEKCTNSGAISGVSMVGGIIGACGSEIKEIKNCYNTGTVSGTMGVGGIVGYSQSAIKYCYNVGAVSGEEYIGGIAGGCDGGSVTSCYYLNTSATVGIGENKGSGEAIAVTETQLKSGEITYKLNNGVTDGTQAWYQTCGEGAPAFTGKTVYKITNTGCTAVAEKYSNTDGQSFAGEHSFDKDGFCICGAYDEPKLVDGYYEIRNAGQLYWFAAKVNRGNETINAKLMDDITVNPGTFDENGNYTAIDGEKPRQWTPIGDFYINYSGTFDGNGKCISNLYVVNSEGANVALFGFIGTGGTVKDVAVKDAYIKGLVFVGGVAGNNFGTITNCYSSGTISGVEYVGGVAGDNAGTITNCMSIATVSGDGYVGGVAGNSTGEVTNCYYLGTYETDEIDGTTYKTDAQLKSGEVTWLLNGKKSEGIWKQTLDGQSYPGFVGGTVYHGYKKCNETLSYSNEELYEKPHDYNENGFCTQTEGQVHYEPAELVDGVYQIKNGGNLFWFAAQVNGGATGISAKLIGDIDLQDREWTAIGTESKPYTGTFDGGDLTISNFKMTVTEGNNQGLFGAVSGGTVKNFTIKGKIDITATIDISDVSNIKSISNVGGVVGYAKNSAVVENVTSYVNITDSHTPFTYTDANGTVQSIRVSGIGGIVGYMDGSTVKGCMYDGTIKSVCGASIAGIVGNASNSSTVDYCTNKGNVSAENNSAHIGGIAGDAQTGTTVSYCLNFGNVTSSGGDCIGGIVAYANQNVKIDNCGNIGTVTCTADGDGFIGGILGYINNGNFKGISNCFNYGSIVTNTGKTAHAGAILGYNRNSGNVYSNNYYLDTSFTKAASDNAISDVYSMTAVQFKSGEVAYKLSGSKNAGVWKQTLGSDDYPNFTGKDVYYGYITCKDTKKSYSNSTVSNTPIPHIYGGDGICTGCGAYQPAVLSGSVYEISNLGQLLWFAAEVNSGETSINGKLMLDIDATSVSYIGIGKDADHAFAGTFDGNNKTLKIALVSTEQYVAPFLYINGATISNLTVSGTIKTTHKFAAGIIGRVVGGNVTLEKCLSLVEIDSTNYSGDGTHGGLIAVVAAGTTTINNCGFAGSIIGEKTTSCAGIVGWTDGGTKTNISNSYVAATFALQNNNGNTFGRNSSNVLLDNCYYLNALSETSVATQMSADSFASGEVAYRLGSAWKQTIGTDSYPNFAGKTVYRYTDCKGGYHYTNTETEGGKHDYNDNGFCKLCDDYEPCEVQDGVYLIKNAGNLYWFAAEVNSGNTTINAKLTADITVNSGVLKSDGKLNGNGSNFRAWMPIGNYSYTGTFDGNGKTISGLYYNGSDNYVGLFGYIRGGATIKNITLTDTYFESSVRGENADAYVGGIAGYVYITDNNTVSISGCTISGTFIATANGNSLESYANASAYAGGIAGYVYVTGNNTVSISDCTISGTVTATADGYSSSAHSDVSAYAGGIVGYAYAVSGGTLKIENCYNTGDVTSKANAISELTAVARAYSGGLVGYACAFSNGTLKIENCYNTGDAMLEADGEDRSTAYLGGLVGYASCSGGSMTLRNCYFLDTYAKAIGGSLGSVTTDKVEAKTEAQFKSGEVTWLLNGKRSEGTTESPLVWKQTLDGKSYPGFTGEIVYPMTNTGKCPKATKFSNKPNESFEGDHTYVDGVCACGHIQTFTITVKYGKDLTDTISVNYGEKPNLNAYRNSYYYAADEGVNYIFNQWDKTVTEAKEDTTYTAVYVKTGWQITAEGRCFWSRGILMHNWLTLTTGEKYYLSMDRDGYAYTGIAQVGDSLYAFDDVTGALIKKDGVYVHSEGTFYLEDGKLIANKGLVRWEKSSNDIRYYYFGTEDDTVNPTKGHNNEYKGFRNVKAYVALKEDGLDLWIADTTGTPLPVWGYFTDDTGMFLRAYSDGYTGIESTEAGKFYCVDGIRAHVGMIKVDGYYYYATRDGSLVVSRNYYCSVMNDTGLAVGTYAFDQNGRLSTSITLRWDDTHEHLYCYDINGNLVYAGLVEYEGNWYYVKTSGEAIVGRTYWISKTNGLMGERSYTFDENGHMTDPTPKEEGKEGIVDGYYYVDGLRTYAGLIQIDGSWYYVKTSGEVVCGKDYWITKTNGHVTEGVYTFAADGKMILD